MILVGAVILWAVGDVYGTLPALSLLVLAVLAYYVHLALWPRRSCSHCQGTGRRFSPSGRAYGDCRWCKGSPGLLRWGTKRFRSSSR